MKTKIRKTYRVTSYSVALGNVTTAVTGHTKAEARRAIGGKIISVEEDPRPILGYKIQFGGVECAQVYPSYVGAHTAAVESRLDDHWVLVPVYEGAIT